MNTANVDPDKIIKKVDDANLKKELPSYQHILVVSELQRARNKVINYAKDDLNAKNVDENLMFSPPT